MKGNLRRRLHVAQHRVAGNAPQRLRFWSTIVIAAGWPWIVMALIFMEHFPASQWAMTIFGSLLILAGVGGHLAAIQIEELHEDETGEDVDW